MEMKNDSNVHTIYSDIFGRFTMDEEFEMNLVHLKNPVKLPNGEFTRCLIAGMVVCVIDNELVSAITSKCASHRILALFGNLANTNFKIQVIDLNTNQVTFVKL